ncbi:MAG: DUF2357 domain-containing protein [Candidatus Enterosoma sp.]|nr:DUF2357 domain-containing protein [bacterium]MDY5865879.1 DUF2357 domain-containing protein [Candidatus Enterosoma sp.]
MNNKQIEKIFFGEDKNLKSQYITYLSYLHVVNSLSKRDSITNDICKDNGFSYIERFKEMYSSINTPLCFLHDKTYDLFLYTTPHIKKIMSNPSQSIIKEKKLIQKSKLKVIDSNTFRWLATKPGTTFKEKLANQEKIMSTVKRYSFDIKENQVFVSYLVKIKDYFNDKKELINKCSDIFGNIDDYKKQFDDAGKFLNKVSSFLKEEFEEVQRKEHATPNNTLIGNVDYSSIWNSNQSLKKDDFDSFEIGDYFNMVFKCFELAIMSSSKYQFIDKNCIIKDINSNYLLYRMNGDIIEEINFDYDGNYNIYINKYRLVEGQFKLDEELSEIHTIEYQAEADSIDNRGIIFTAFIDDEEYKINADLLGLKDFIQTLAKELSIELDFNREYSIQSFTFEESSINAYNNHLSSNNYRIMPHIIYDGNNSFEVLNSLYFVNDDNVYIDTYADANKYNELLQNYRKHYKKDSDSLLIYDIKDSFDEFSSKSLRNNYSINFPNSYPVWRSILSAESINGYYPDLVVDLTGKEVYATALGRKKDLYVHKGVISWPLNLLKYSEKNFLLDYLDSYSEDNDVQFSDDVINDCLTSGSLSKLLIDRKGSIIMAEGDESSHEYIRIEFDKDIYEKCFNDFVKVVDDIREEFKDKKLLIVIPDYIDSSSIDNAINNKKLIKGASIIRERVQNQQIAWYECLPDLSLEIIKNGYYDYLKLVENRECENIIGKSDSWLLDEKFVLKAGKSDYILPLIKSFVGEQNKSFDAVIKNPAFPLKEDVEVYLKLNYSYGNDNSYILTFLPVNKENAPFKKIVVDWEENHTIDYLKELPNIKDIDYTLEEQDIIVGYIKKSVRDIDFVYSDYNKNKINKQEVLKKLNRMANDFQKMLAADYPTISDVHEIILNSKVPYALIDLYNDARIGYEKTDENTYERNRIESTLMFLEQDRIQLTFDRTLLVEKKFIFPETCFGRYLVSHIDDYEVINEAYDNLIIDYKLGDLLHNLRLKTYLDRLTSATQMDHLFFKKLCKYNKPYVYKVLEIITAVMKEISNYSFEFETRDKQCNPKEISYLMRFCVELLISYLYVRDEPLFEELRPDGRLAHEIISYIKIFNKNYQNALDIWSDRFKKPRMETKYRMTYKNKPAELYRVWEDAYCLILYLSGAKEANNIILGSKDDYE